MHGKFFKSYRKSLRFCGNFIPTVSFSLSFFSSRRPSENKARHRTSALKNSRFEQAKRQRSSRGPISAVFCLTFHGRGNFLSPPRNGALLFDGNRQIKRFTIQLKGDPERSLSNGFSARMHHQTQRRIFAGKLNLRDAF